MKTTLMKFSRLWIIGFFCFQLIACAAWAGPETPKNLSVTVHSGSSENPGEAGDPASTGIAGEGGDAGGDAQNRAAGDGDPVRPDRDPDEMQVDAPPYEPVIMVIDNESDAADPRTGAADMNERSALFPRDSGDISPPPLKKRRCPTPTAWCLISTMPIWWR